MIEEKGCPRRLALLADRLKYQVPDISGCAIPEASDSLRFSTTMLAPSSQPSTRLAFFGKYTDENYFNQRGLHYDPDRLLCLK